MEIDYSVKNGKLYLVKNKITGEGYVGQTKKLVATRWKVHKKGAREFIKIQDSLNAPDISETETKRLQRKLYALSSRTLYAAMAKHGLDNFEVSLLREGVKDRRELDELEQDAIAEHGTRYPNGYNKHPGGGFAKSIRREVKAKITGKKKKAQGIPKHLSFAPALREFSPERPNFLGLVSTCGAFFVLLGKKDFILYDWDEKKGECHQDQIAKTCLLHGGMVPAPRRKGKNMFRAKGWDGP